VKNSRTSLIRALSNSFILFSEGVVPQDLLGVLRILEIKKWFKMEDYNRALKNMKFSRQEASSKPQLVPVIKKIKRLSGKAISQWVHIRNFAYILYVNNWIQMSRTLYFNWLNLWLD